jgi:serine/threonine protein kinase
MLAKLEHENIVKIYDIGSTDDAVYMVMEYLRGGTLTQKMQSGQLVLRDVIKICAQVSLALHVAHHKNIIHRDLKPSNIMFRDPVTPVLTDFGIARQIDLDMTLTETGMMIGTPQYMSPEQIQGKPVDGRSDIYSLGLMFYRMLTGDLPFDATDPIAMAMQHIQEDPPPLPDELAELQPVMDLMLAKDPNDRYQSTLDFCNHLRTISLTGEEYSTELSTATRIFTSAQFSAPGSIPSAKAIRPGTTETSSVSRTFTSISTAVSAVFKQKKPRNIMLGSVLAAVVAVIIAFQFFSHGLSDAELKRIDRELTRFNAYLALDQISSPEGENATESVEKMLEIAPDFSKVREAASELADIYETSAYDYYDRENLDDALAMIDQGLELVPDHEGLSELKESVGARVDARDRLQKIDSLLAAGNRALKDNNLLPPREGNAYDAFLEVRTLDLQNESAEAGLSDIQRQVERSARAAWNTEGRDSAKASTLEALEFFKDSTLLLNLKAEMEREEQSEQAQLELERLLALAEEQIADGKLVEPPGDNALESYRRARELKPNDLAVATGLEQIASHYLALAQNLFNENAFQDSLDATANGLKALPDHPGLLEAQGNATSRLDEHNRAIQTRIQQAERLVASGLLIPGQSGMDADSDNAMQAFNQVLEIDPGNAKAMAGLTRLPARVEDAASQLERVGKLQEAKELLQAAAPVYQDRATQYETRIALLDQKIAERAAELKMQEQLVALDDLLQQRPVTRELFDNIARSLREISSEDRYQMEASDRLGRFIGMIAGEADQASIDGDNEHALDVIEYGLISYPGNPRLMQTRVTVLQRQSERERLERERITAMSGVLAIDAVPWARVLEVRNSEQVLQDLPDSTETPLFMTLLEGEYTVLVASADGGEQLELAASVRRQEVETIRPEAVQMNSAEYFEKSGW